MSFANPTPTIFFPSAKAWSDAGHPVGGVFRIHILEWDKSRESFPDRYVRLARIGQCYWVVLPTGQWWCPWKKAYTKEKGWHGNGWDISGPPERMTVMPSIAVEGYHGFLRNGILSPG